MHIKDLSTPAPASLGQRCVALLENLAVLEVKGGDAESFLQGQLCNDVTALPANGVQTNGYCSPRGRLLAIFYLIRDGERFLLLLPKSVHEGFRKRLSMFVLRAEVEITEHPAARVLALMEPAELTSFTPERPGSPGEGSMLARDCWIGRLRGENACWLLVGGEDALDLHMQSLATDTVATTSNHWLGTRLLEGEPTILAETVDRFVPQMVNLDLIDGLSFSKGCYPGQEIIARTRYLGKQKRRMLIFKLGDSVNSFDLKPGVGLFDSDNETVGELVAAAEMEQATVLAAVLRLEHRDRQLFVEVDGERHKLSPLTLPYDAMQGTAFSNDE